MRMGETGTLSEEQPAKRRQRYPWLGLVAFTLSLLSLLAIPIGVAAMWLMTPAPAPPPPPTPTQRMQQIQQQSGTLKDAAKEAAKDAGRSLVDGLRNRLEGNDTPTSPSDAEETDHLSIELDETVIDVRNTPSGWQITILPPSNNPTQPSNSPPDWVAILTAILMVGGSVLGIALGGVSVIIGEPARLGSLAASLGVSVLTFVLTVIYWGLLIAGFILAVLVICLAVLVAAVTGVQVDIPSIDIPSF